MAERISKSECDRFVKAAKCCAGIAGCVESDECPMWRAGDCERNFGGMVLALDALAAERDELKAKVADLESELKLNAKMLARQTDLARAAETPAAGAMPWWVRPVLFGLMKIQHRYWNAHNSMPQSESVVAGQAAKSVDEIIDEVEIAHAAGGAS